jgi:hypothetical protein
VAVATSDAVAPTRTPATWCRHQADHHLCVHARHPQPVQAAAQPYALQQTGVSPLCAASLGVGTPPLHAAVRLAVDSGFPDSICWLVRWRVRRHRAGHQDARIARQASARLRSPPNLLHACAEEGVEQTSGRAHKVGHQPLHRALVQVPKRSQAGAKRMVPASGPGREEARQYTAIQKEGPPTAPRIRSGPQASDQRWKPPHTNARRPRALVPLRVPELRSCERQSLKKRKKRKAH